MLNMAYWDRKTNIWVREKTKVTYVIEQVRRRSGPGQGTSAGYDIIDGLHIITWKPYERKRPSGRPARQRRDE